MPANWGGSENWDGGLLWGPTTTVVPANAPSSQPIGSVEIAMTNFGWGGQMIMGPTGDVVLLQDVPGNPAATLQRIYRLMLTSCMTFDASHNPITCADDLFNVLWGVGLPSRVGQMFDNTFVSQITNQCLAALATDPGITETPAPTVSVQYVGGGAVAVNVSCNTIAGEVLVVPTIKIKVS